ncbi:O-antigen ligase family protein [Luteimonas sp. A649]
MKHLLVVALVLTYIALSAFLEVDDSQRVVISDLVLVGLMCIAAFNAIATKRLLLPRVHLAAFPMVVVFLLATVLAVNKDRALMELVVLVFCLVGSIVIVNLLAGLPEGWLSRLLRWYVLVIGALALVCVTDFLLLPGLISSRSLGGLQGPFRNTGQAGAYFGLHVFVITALIMSGIVPRRFLYVASGIVTFLALVFTLKRASILAFAVGVVVLVLVLLFGSASRRDKRAAISFVVASALIGTIGLALFQWALGEVSGLRWRLETKFAMSALDSFQDGFLAENIQSTMSAFSDSPIIGVGLDNVRDVYQSHEIHSTYLAIAAYGGASGVVAYSWFMVSFLMGMYRESKFHLSNMWARLLYLLLPLTIGLMVGWGYTYHLRKREFWLMVAFVALAIRMSQKQRNPFRDSVEADAAHEVREAEGARGLIDGHADSHY